MATETAHARAPDDQRQADPSRSGLLARRRRHQGRPGPLLRRGLAPHGALHRRPAAGAGALPGGHRRAGFFQKHAWQGLSRSIVLVQDPEEPEALLSIRDLDGLIGSGPGGGAGNPSLGLDCRRLDQPDMIIMDLDPGEAVSWHEVIAAASEVRERLDERRPGSFVKTSGGKGLHVVAPLKPKADWPAVKAFTKVDRRRHGGRQPRALRRDHHQGEAARQDPDRLSAQRARPTAVAPYSTRARPARRSRCRWPGTSSGPESGRPISRSTTRRRGSPRLPPIHGRISARARRRSRRERPRSRPGSADRAATTALSASWRRRRCGATRP